MGGINSLSGLNNVSVDFRPTIQVNEQKPGDANRLLPEADGAPGEAKQPQKAEARSVVQKLDVLLMEMADPAKKNAYLDTIRSRVSPEALEATSKRIDEAIAYAQKLNAGGKVYGKEQWRDWNKIVAMTGVKANVTITKVNDDKLKVGGDIEIVSDYNERNCPSLFKREYLHKMFNKPV